jgi:hypothetical protein
MKNSLVSFALVLGMISPSLSFGYNTEYFPVTSEYTTRVDVAGRVPIISFRVTIQSLDAFSVPEAVVTREDADFNCRIVKRILLTADFNSVTKVHTQDYEIGVEWAPGGDLSGCLVEITHPSLVDAFGYLYMSY